MLALILILFATPTQTPEPVVWGWDAHKMVCLIAWWEMEDGTRSQITDLLKSDPEYGRFMESCLWADDIRGRDDSYARWSSAHYVNLPRGAERFDMERDCGNTFCVVEAILESKATLRDPISTQKQRLDALKFLAHFIGDIHQPMHAGYGDDRGGNDTAVVLFGRETNLHATWDYGLVSHTQKEWKDYAAMLFFEISCADRTDWASDDPARWTEESYAIISDSAYQIGDGAIGQAYYDRHIAVIEKRIKQAAVRLADQLDHIFSQ